MKPTITKATGSSRAKISTTVAPETLHYLERLIAKGEAENLAEAIDVLVQRLLAQEQRSRLEHDTAAYFERLSPTAAAEEAELERALSGAAKGVDFDRQP